MSLRQRIADAKPDKAPECPRCGGTGFTSCLTCRGQGVIKKASPAATFPKTGGLTRCPTCRGARIRPCICKR